MYKFIVVLKSKVDITRPSDCIIKTKEQPKRAVTLLLKQQLIFPSILRDKFIRCIGMENFGKSNIF